MKGFKYKKLKSVRLGRGLTQAEMAEKIGIARTTYADYEKGNILPPLDKIKRICSLFDLELADLMDLDDVPGVDTDALGFLGSMSDGKKLELIKRSRRRCEAYDLLTSTMKAVHFSTLEPQEIDAICGVLECFRIKYTPTRMDMDIKRRLKDGDLYD